MGLWAQEQGTAPKHPFKTAEGLVTELYKSVTFKAGTTPDWKKVRTMFVDKAVVVMRTTRTKSTVFSVDGFVDDFIQFIEPGMNAS